TVAIKEKAKDPTGTDAALAAKITKATIEKYLGTNTKVADITATTSAEAVTKAIVSVSKTAKGTTADYWVTFADGKEPVVSTTKP
ncbi:MAG: hypothetical protein RSD92_08130, partial [Erysipelotrichaceae bacterium]